MLSDYGQWQESQNITTDRNWNFSTAIWMTNPLPKLDPDMQKYLQVEIKSATLSNSVFKLLDVDGDPNNATDRRFLHSSPYAITADIDPADINYVYSPEFIINYNTTWVDVTLKFWNSFDHILKWVQDKFRFELSNTLFVHGDLLSTWSLTVDWSWSINWRDVDTYFDKIDNINALWIPFSATWGITSTNVQKAIEELSSKVADDQIASEVAFSWSWFTSTDVHNALQELSSRISASSDDQLATEVPFSGSWFTSTDVQSAIEELNSKVSDDQNDYEVPYTWTAITASTVKQAIDQLAPKSKLRSLITWSYAPWTDWDVNEGQDTRRNIGQIMMHDWKITWMSVFDNPSDTTPAWWFYITSNDNWYFNWSKILTQLWDNNWWEWDAYCKAYTTYPQPHPYWLNTLNFNAWDVLRVYHYWSASIDTFITLEVEYFD